MEPKRERERARDRRREVKELEIQRDPAANRAPATARSDDGRRRWFAGDAMARAAGHATRTATPTSGATGLWARTAAVEAKSRTAKEPADGATT
ncbi:hypothetical protein Scep_019287 [Stephania cephalantha]|uniref:Uncharacterized protein n=1 Tax=Stephania cephalantha TaxID=152367 RepID=A0AAP0IAX7_9MAGN